MAGRIGEATGLAPHQRVIVVGAGIVGASIAYHLAARGADVTVIDASLPASGATGASFGWIGRPRSSSAPSGPLRMMALDEYHRLESEIPGLRVNWSGSLMWDRFAEGGVDATPDVERLEPGLSSRPPSVDHRPGDGAVDPVAATEAMIDAARSRGAKTVFGTPVLGIERSGGVVSGVRTAESTLSASVVVLAAGVGAVALCDRVGIALAIRADPAVLIRLRAAPGAVRTIVAGDFEVRQERDGTLLMPLEYAGEISRRDLSSSARRARRLLMEAFDGLNDVEVVSAEVGWRPMPADGEPIIGPEPDVPGLYLAVMHSGVTLAAAAGRLVAEEITTGRPAAEFAACRRRES